MRTRVLSVLSAAALVCAVMLVGSPTAQAAGTSSITGTISLPDGFSFLDPTYSGSLLIGHVDTSGDSPIVDQTSDVYINVDGTYRADGLVPGQSYVVVVPSASLPIERVGLLTTAYGGWTSMGNWNFYDQVSDPAFGKVVAPAAGTTTQNIDITMVQGGVVSGNITPASADGQVINVCEVQDFPHVCSRSDIAADGSYQVAVMPGHPVVVYARADGYATTFLGGHVGLGYPNDLPATQATQVTVPTARGTETGLDIQLARGATISGKILPANAGLLWVWVCEVMDNQIGDCDESMTTTSGSYSVTVPPGSTVVLFAQTDGFLQTWFGGATGYPFLPNAGVTQLVAPGGGQALTDKNISLVRDGAPPVKPMLRFTLGESMSGWDPGQILAVDSKGVLWGFGLKAGNKLSPGFRLGTGFSSYQIFGPGDLNNDSWSDVLGISSDGKLWLFPGNTTDPLSPKKQVGWGWAVGWRMIPAGDLTGDGQPDLLGIDPKGDLYLYQGKSDGTFPYPKVKVGWGWKNWNLYAAGDLNGDGKADILGIDSKGDLYQYRGSGNASNPFPYAKQKAGWGWNGGFVMAAGADLNGDGYADIISRQTSTKNLYVYYGLGNAKFQAKTLIDTGW